MGAILSKIDTVMKKERVKKAKGRLLKLVKHAWWLGGHITWTCMTGVIVLAVPVFFEYERECQMFETIALQQNAQMNAAPPPA